MEDTAYHEPLRRGAYGAGPSLPQSQADSLVKLVAASVLTRTGESYFDSLLRLFSVQFDMQLGLVGAIDSAGENIGTLVTFERGRRVANFGYPLKGTPCETIFSPTQICVYPQDVAELFPADEILDEIGAVGYVGMPLFCRDGEAIGILALCSATPIMDPEGIAAMLKVFGKRSSIELEHLLAVQRAHASAALLEQAAHDEECSLADFVQRLDS